MRRILFMYSSERVGSTLDKTMNYLARGKALKIIVDRKEAAKMINQQDTEIRVSEAAHTICVTSTGMTSVVAINAELPGGTAIKIPAGTEEYVVLINKEGPAYRLCAGTVQDEFYRSLEKYIKGMCQEEGILRRLRMPENRNRCLYISFSPEFFSLQWDLASTKGLKQWATGRGEEKFLYAMIGIRPPQKQPSGYWRFIQMMMARVIDSSVKFQCSLDGMITER